jgi:RimJ/RimL family protein N-acetyltransferase
VPAQRPVTGVIEGRFIRLEPLTDAQLPELFRAIGVPEVFAGGWGGGPAAYRATEAEFVEFARRLFPWEGGNVYAIRLVGGPDASALVGTTTLADFDEAVEHAHLGWTAYAPQVWATAVNPEAKLLVLGEAFDHGFGRVKLQADVRNERSRAAIAKLGAQFEGIVRRDRPRADGSWRDTAVYSILAEEWPGVKAALEARLAASGTEPVTLHR